MMSLTFGLFTQVSGSGPIGPLVLKSELRFMRCNPKFYDQTTQSCDELGVVGSLDR